MRCGACRAGSSRCRRRRRRSRRSEAAPCAPCWPPLRWRCSRLAERVAGRSGRAVGVAASGKANVELLELAIKVRALEPRLFGDLAHVRLLAIQELLEINPLERFARFAQRQIEEPRGNLGCNRPILRDCFAQQSFDVLDADIAAYDLQVFDDAREMIEVAGPL